MSPTWKNLAIKGAVGIALFVLANVVVYYTSGFFQRERQYHETVSELFAHPEVSVVFMGDSHVAEIPDELLGEGVYNLAAGGDGYRELYAKLRYVLSEPQQVRTLLLTVDYHMFGSGRVHSANRSFVDRYLLATRSDIGYEKNWLSTLFNLAPLCNDDFVQYLKKDVREMLRRRHAQGQGAETAWSDLPQSVREQRALSTGRGDHAGVGTATQTFYWFEKTVQLARRHGIEVVAIRYPTSEGYRSQVPAAGMATVDAELARIGAPMPIDLGNALREPAYFADEDHVNSRGAAALLCMLEARTGLALPAATIRRDCGLVASSAQAGASE